MFCNVIVGLIVISIMHKFNFHFDVDFSKYPGVTGACSVHKQYKLHVR